MDLNKTSIIFWASNVYCYNGQMHLKSSSISQIMQFEFFRKFAIVRDRKDWSLMIGWVWYYLPGRYLCVVDGMGVKQEKIIKILQKETTNKRNIDVAINNSAQSSCDRMRRVQYWTTEERTERF